MATTTQLVQMLQGIAVSNIPQPVVESIDKMMEKADICINAGISSGAPIPNVELDRYNRLSQAFKALIGGGGVITPTPVINNNAPVPTNQPSIDLKQMEDEIVDLFNKRPRLFALMAYRYLNQAMNMRISSIDYEIGEEKKKLVNP